MLGIFTKPLELIGSHDVAELCDKKWPEGYTVEYKKTLPHKSGGSDSWLAGADKIGDFARDQILEEVIAFANAEGGTVIVGISETKEKPPRADAIEPLARVGELETRFADAARSCIEPALPGLRMRAVETEPGKGVLILRVGPSRAAPHRLKTTRECYVRHDTSTIKMTMREIQNMSLNVARGMEQVYATFAERKQRFHDTLSNPGSGRLAAIRATAVPLVQIPDPGRIMDTPGVLAPLREFTFCVSGRTLKTDLFSPRFDSRERPIVRGLMRTVTTDMIRFREEVYQSGLVDVWFGTPPTEKGGQRYLTWLHMDVLGAASLAMWQSAAIRSVVGMPEAEYSLEVELTDSGGGSEKKIYESALHDYGRGGHEVPSVPIELPRIPFGDESSFEAVINTLDVDIFDALGVRRMSRSPIAVSIE